MFEQLMKYPIDVFREGDFSFGVPIPGLLIFVLMVGLIAATIWAYRSTKGRTGRVFRGFLIVLRTIVLCFLAFCLLKPFLTIYQNNPDDSYLLVMVDRSKSMQITDSDDGESRLNQVNQLLFGENPEDGGGLIDKLNANKFKVRLFGFDTEAKRIENVALPSADGENTNIPKALNEALEDLQGIPLSGIVLCTDGVDRSGTDMAKLAMQVRQRKAPIHTVGIGSAEGVSDIELVKVDAPRSAEEDFPVDISATVKRTGNTPKKATIHLIENGRILETVPVSMKNETTRVPLKFTPRQPGTRKYEVQVLPEADEVIPQNNTKTFILKVAPTKRVKILFVSRPFWGFKFIKRALQGDPNIILTDRYTTSDRSFGGTQGAADQDFKFYPDSKDALFDFDAIIFGNIGASKFTRSQLENTVEFVRTRGGGFLMLGGTHSLGNSEVTGSYLNTPIAELLPVELELGDPPPPVPTLPPSQMPRIKGFKLQLTTEGKTEPLMGLANNPAENLQRWNEMSELFGYSKVKRAKAGATILAEHPSERNEFGNRILIATHNYNAGRVMVFTPNNSYRWHTIPEKENDNHHRFNDNHHRFWRQVAKWLTTAPKSSLEINLVKTEYTLKEPVVIEVTAMDKTFTVTNEAKLRAVIIDETGTRRELPLEQVLGKDGLYTARFVPNRYGEYTVTATGTLHGEDLGKQQALFEVKPSYAEFSDASLNIPLLTNLADMSGGKYYPIEEADQLVNQISLVESATSQITDIDIWDLPLIFGTILMLLGLEWFLRKRGGLV
ncbi:hypothetical protein C6501_18820 [Candidatus Poribacteria bacterium]|nr:MAG: hypothetical protein C6501_18820 [Candidatus Poribacteria bacterium]